MCSLLITLLNRGLQKWEKLLGLQNGDPNEIKIEDRQLFFLEICKISTFVRGTL